MAIKASQTGTVDPRTILAWVQLAALVVGMLWGWFALKSDNKTNADGIARIEASLRDEIKPALSAVKSKQTKDSERLVRIEERLKIKDD